MESCAECRARQQRERQYLERLRSAAVPDASGDLTARLLARTEQLAAERTAAERSDTGWSDAARSDTPPAGTRLTDPERERGDAQRVPTAGPHAGAFGTPRPGMPWPSAGGAAVTDPAQGAARGSRGPLPPVLAAGGAVAALALMAGTAYFMGSDATIPADSSEVAALAQSEMAGPLEPEEQPGAEGAGSPLTPGDAGSGTRIGFGLDGEPDFTPAGALSMGQLAAFRSQGWACPELRELGFHLVWARAGAIAGDEVLELRLTDGQHFATILEQHASGRHASSRQAPGTPLAPGSAEPSPINVLTGHSAEADGFTPVRAGAPAGAPDAGNGALWVNPAPPFRAIYQTVAATYTYKTDLPAEQAADAADALAGAGGATPAPAAAEGIGERMERGLGRILASLAP